MSGKSWYYTQNGSKIGPVGSRELRQLAAIGAITRDSLVWNTEGRTIRAGRIRGLFDAIAANGDRPATSVATPPALDVAEVPDNWNGTDHSGELGAKSLTSISNDILVRFREDPWECLPHMFLGGTRSATWLQIGIRAGFLLVAVIVVIALHPKFGRFLPVSALALAATLEYAVSWIPWLYRKHVNRESKQIMHVASAVISGESPSAFILELKLTLQPGWTLTSRTAIGSGSEDVLNFVLFQNQPTSPITIPELRIPSVSRDQSGHMSSNLRSWRLQLRLPEDTAGTTLVLSGYLQCFAHYRGSEVAHEVRHYVREHLRCANTSGL